MDTDRSGAKPINERLFRANTHLGNYRISSSPFVAMGMIDRTIKDLEEAIFLLQIERNLCELEAANRNAELAKVGIRPPTKGEENKRFV